VNVLSSADDQLAVRFARSGADRFADVDWWPAQGLPRLDCAVGWAACELQQVVEGGDHLLLVGLVVHAESRPAAPLVYGHRTFGTHSRFAHRPRRPVIDSIAACAS
jgi:flavin reductase (DIM6/NTAB) family NADH-FMN oxidoreductase RutF